MTRDFSKQRRDGQRPPSRNSFSSGRYNEEESFKPARPRLSRDAVDRAWENGAPRRYADYQPRQNSSTPPVRRQGRPTSPHENYRASQNRGTYSPRSEQFRSPSSGQRSSYEDASENGSRPSSPPGHRAPNRPGLNSGRWAREQRDFPSESRGNGEQYRAQRPPLSQQNGYNSAGRGNTRFERGSREQGNTYGERERENFARGRQNNGPRPRRDNYNPRWQSRQTTQNEYPSQNGFSSQNGYSRQGSSHAPGQGYSTPQPFRRYRQEQPEVEQFKGDYEHFDNVEQPERPEKPFEKHVTRLPNGRVIKGSRPAQRKQASFWNDVEAEAEALRNQKAETLDQAYSEQTPEVLSPNESEESKPPRSRKTTTGKTRTVKTVKTARADKTNPGAKVSKARASKKKADVPKHTGPVMRPSRRGFKWPSAREEA